MHSLSHKGSPYDNTCTESFHVTPKGKKSTMSRYLDFASAKLALLQYIESWYNRNRIHGSVHYKSL